MVGSLPIVFLGLWKRRLDTPFVWLIPGFNPQSIDPHIRKLLINPAYKHIIWTNIWVNYNDLTVLPHWNHGLWRKSSPNGPTIQVSEILSHLPSNIRTNFLHPMISPWKKITIPSFHDRWSRWSPWRPVASGDLEHTHLVKGLDFALLNKVRAELNKQKKVEEVQSLAGWKIWKPKPRVEQTAGILVMKELVMK